MKLLFITQKLHGQDAFTALWVKAFIERGYEVEVLCLEWRPADMQSVLGEVSLLPFAVHSLGKEQGRGKWAQIFQFWKLISTLQYDRVFIHMTPVWGFLGAPIFLARRAKVYLWYTHYKMQIGLWLLGLYGKRLFCATKQSLPQYEGSEKKIVTGHGIDLHYWPMRENCSTEPAKLLGVYRLSRSKRLELCVQAMALLPEQYTWDVYGNEAEPEYVAEVKALVKNMHLEHRITFHPSVPIKDLPALYQRHRFILNMATETIDKTMLEAMTCGCFPVVTPRNAEAVGLPIAQEEDNPASVAAFLRDHTVTAPVAGPVLYDIVQKRHSLEHIVELIDSYIQKGI
jgi:glycosyltransferase involved in cell wall biosynthesis